MHKYFIFSLFLAFAACSSLPHGTKEYFSYTAAGNEKVTNASFISYDSPSFRSMLQKRSSVQIVDVRTPKEYAAGHIDKAIQISVTEKDFLDNCIKQLDRKKPVAVYCKGGVRSRNAAKLLVQNGFKVYNLDKGYDDWIKE